MERSIPNGSAVVAVHGPRATVARPPAYGIGARGGSGTLDREDGLGANAIAHAGRPLRPLRGHGHHQGRVLLVEDEPDQAAILEAVLRHEGLDVVVTASGEQALDVHQRTPADVLVTDLNLPGMTGVDLMRRLAPPFAPDAPEPKLPPPAIVVVTGGGTVCTAVEALKLGAADYLQKPLDPARLVSLIRELLASDNVREAEGDDDEAPGGALVFEGMVGGSRRMREVFNRIDRVAGTTAPVLVVGESGTGKELVARAIHARSRRHAGPFVPVHTGAIPRELTGSELFGHEKGSFTGAFAAAEGKFEAAAGGTVFLDEVGTMDSAVQVSLLRVLETYRFTRVGGRKEIEADVRIVAATNKDLLDLVDDAIFREDLYYRLNVFTVTLPPLREREEDILPIAERFLVKYAKRYGTPARRLSVAAVERLYHHDWPGNVRELRNVVEQTALFATTEVVSAEEIQLGQGRIERRPRRGHEATAPPPPAPAGPGEGGPAQVDAPRIHEERPPPPPPGGPSFAPRPPSSPAANDAGSARAGTTPVPSSYEQVARSAPFSAQNGVPFPRPPPASPFGASEPCPAPRAPLESYPGAHAAPVLVSSVPSSFPPGAQAPRPPADSLHDGVTNGARPSPSPPPAHDPEPPRDAEADHPLVLRLPVGTRLADAERRLILLTLEAVRGNKQRAARVLGISRRGLYSKLQAYGEHVSNQDAQEPPEATEAAEEAPASSQPAPPVPDPPGAPSAPSAEDGPTLPVGAAPPDPCVDEGPTLPTGLPFVDPDPVPGDAAGAMSGGFHDGPPPRAPQNPETTLPPEDPGHAPVGPPPGEPSTLP
jgi:DNA-binding NtrC family response regulator